MFTTGFSKVAAGNFSIVPKDLKDLTGATAMKPYNNTVSKFGKSPKRALVALSRIRDGLR